MNHATEFGEFANTATIKLPAVISIVETGALRSGLLDALNTDGNVAIDASAVERIDTAGLQLLAAFAESVDKRQRPFCWHGATPVIINAAGRLGLSAMLRLPEKPAVER